MTKALTSGRLRRQATRPKKLLTVASLTMLVLTSLVLVASPTPASADINPFPHMGIGTFDCVGTTTGPQMTVRRPEMTSLYGDWENVYWYPAIQKWNASSGVWVNYATSGWYRGVANSQQSKNWVDPRGQLKTVVAFTADLEPGGIYRAVNYVDWKDAWNFDLTQSRSGVLGPYRSSYFLDSTDFYCFS